MYLHFTLSIMVTQVGRWKGSLTTTRSSPPPRSPTIKDSGLCAWVHLQDCELGPFSKAILIAFVARRPPWESPDLLVPGLLKRAPCPQMASICFWLHQKLAPSQCSVLSGFWGIPSDTRELLCLFPGFPWATRDLERGMHPVPTGMIRTWELFSIPSSSKGVCASEKHSQAPKTGPWSSCAERPCVAEPIPKQDRGDTEPSLTF